MKIIIIEDVVYKITEKQFRDLKAKELSLKGNRYLEFELEKFLETRKPIYKYIGLIDFQFRI